MASDRDTIDMRATLLGPLTIGTDAQGGPHAGQSPSAFKPRQALALLLLNANRTVPVGEFTRELWDERPPLSALATLQTYILQLRRFIQKALSISAEVTAKKVLLTVPGGYLFRIEPGHLDLAVFNRLATQGGQTLVTGDTEKAAAILREALEMWQGRALVDVPAGPVVAPRVRGLEEARLVVQEQCIDAELRCGRHREVLSELAALIIEHRYNETLHGHFMLALHRSGRRSEALETYQRMRATLIDEVGLEPSGSLQRLHQAILTDEVQPAAWAGQLASQW
jgi:SARP family transcriptional regulator, regulator of embCAB operon